MTRPSHVTPVQCAALLGLTKAAVTVAMHRGAIIPVIVAGRRMIPIEQVEAWQAERRARLEAQLAAMSEIGP